ncbi:hypothetical protein JNG76_18395 [Proteus mirabilis]|nr:hypothetical protein [Proteus mirabilis]
MSSTVQPLRRCFFRVIGFASLTAQSGRSCLGFCAAFSALGDNSIIEPIKPHPGLPVAF